MRARCDPGRPEIEEPTDPGEPYEAFAGCGRFGKLVVVT
jgi:hypothetical protein